MAKYRPAKGAMYDAKMAVVLGKIIEQLGEHVTPAQLVEMARPVRSPIHKLFEWDDTKAAEAHRLQQARVHISHLEIIVTSRADSESTRGFHSVIVRQEETVNRCYVSTANIRKSSDLSAQVIAKAFRELESWKAKYSQYQGIFGPVFDAIQKVKSSRKAVA